MVRKKGEGESDTEGEGKEEEEIKRVELLKQKTSRLKCPVCGAPSRLRLSDGAIMCTLGGHITLPDGSVTLPGGIKTTLSELREKGVVKEVER